MGFDLAGFKEHYAKDAESAVTDFWANYDKEATTLWRCTYDYPEDTENLDAAKEIVTSFMKNTEPLKGKCFAVMLTLKNFEIEGLFLMEGPDPEPLFGINEDTSWFTWAQLGPDASDAIKKMVGDVWVAKGEYNGKPVEDTQTV
jgi:hypothetical protein